MSGIMYKNIPYAGGGGAGGGSSITYGYVNPTSTGNNGDIYILLDENNKEKGKFLYMSNEWVLISGNMILPLPIMKYKYANNYQAVPYSYTYTVDNAGNYFAFVNIAAMGGSADIVSTGTQKYYNTFGADANRKTVVAVFECNVGDTITLTMDKTGTSYQDYYILAATILDMNTSFDTVTLESLQTKVENNTATATASTTGSKFAFAFNGCLSDVGHSLSCTPSNIAVVEFSEENIKYMECLATVADNLSSVSAITSNSSGYATSVALILNLLST